MKVSLVRDDVPRYVVVRADNQLGTIWQYWLVDSGYRAVVRKSTYDYVIELGGVSVIQGACVKSTSGDSLCLGGTLGTCHDKGFS